MGALAMRQETSLGGPEGGFARTLWTLVLRARGRSRDALDELIRMYWKPSYFYIRRWGAAPEEAKDLCQGFFLELLERDSLRTVSPEKGRFRAFLLAALKHYLINQAERSRARKRGGGRTPLPLDYARAEREFAVAPETRETPEGSFNRRWALEAMTRALEALGREMDPAAFEAIKPHLAGGPAYEETAAKLGVPVSRLNNMIHRARRRYRDLLRSEVAGSVADPDLIEGEVRDLLDAVKA